MKRLNEILDFDQKDHRGIVTDKALKKHFDYSKIESHERHSMDQYRAGLSGALNTYHMRNHQMTLNNPHENAIANIDEDTVKMMERDTKHIDKVIKSNVTPQKLVVYSGIHNDPRIKMNDEKIVHHPAYLSTSVSQNIAEHFAESKSDNNPGQKHILKIHVPKGHHAAYMPSIANTNLSKEEKEVVLPRGLNMKHIKTTQENGFNMHHMRIV